MHKKILGSLAACSAALAVAASAAQADDLSALKRQIEALHQRLQVIEADAAERGAAALLSMRRGHQGGDDALLADALLDRAPATRGMTIAITPAADLPAPVATLELSGHVRAVALWHDASRKAKLEDFDLLARGQVDLRASMETAIGRVEGGLQMRGDFDTPGMGETDVRLRTAWATWHMTQNLSFSFGQLAQIATLSNVRSGLMDINKPFGPDNSRRPQFRLAYADGPFDLRFGIEDSSQGYTDSDETAMPDFAASLGVGGETIGLRVGGEVGKVGIAGSSYKTGWLVNAGINMRLGGVLTASFGGVYTRGLGCDELLFGGLGCVNGASATLVKAWGAQANLGLQLSETLLANASFGYFKGTNVEADWAYEKGYSIGANLVYRPVEALQFALEGSYADSRFVNGVKDRDLSLGIGSWFFF